MLFKNELIKNNSINGEFCIGFSVIDEKHLYRKTIKQMFCVICKEWCWHIYSNNIQSDTLQWVLFSLKFNNDSVCGEHVLYLVNCSLQTCFSMLKALWFRDRRLNRFSRLIQKKLLFQNMHNHLMNITSFSFVGLKHEFAFGAR